jgi:hypothetical protein
MSVAKSASVVKSVKKGINKWIHPQIVDTPLRTNLKSIDTPSTAASSLLEEEDAAAERSSLDGEDEEDAETAASSSHKDVVDTNLFAENTAAVKGSLSQSWREKLPTMVQRVVYKVWVESEWLNVHNYQEFQDFCIYLQEVENTLSGGDVLID